MDSVETNSLTDSGVLSLTKNGDGIGDRLTGCI